MSEDTQNIGLTVELDATYEEAVDRVTAALKEQGFGILTEIDIKATLKQKIDADFRKYVILGACNPKLAHRALSSNLEVGLLLPCNTVVYESEPGRSVISIMDPLLMMSVIPDEELEEVAIEARALLKTALKSL